MFVIAMIIDRVFCMTFFSVCHSFAGGLNENLAHSDDSALNVPVAITVSKFEGEEAPQDRTQRCLCCQADFTEF